MVVAARVSSVRTGASDLASPNYVTPQVLLSQKNGGTLKTPLVGAKEHRLEAYANATLAFRTVERSPRAVPGAIAVHPARDATALV